MLCRVQDLLRGLVALEARRNRVGEALGAVRVAGDRVGVGVLAGGFTVGGGAGTGQEGSGGGDIEGLLFEPFLEKGLEKYMLKY